MVNRAGFEEMDIEEGKVYFYEFHYDPLKYGYLADMFEEKENPPNEFVDLPLTYVGSVKWTGEGNEELAYISSYLVSSEKDGVRYTHHSFLLINDRVEYNEIFVDSNEIYDMNFKAEKKEGKIYILQFGNELEQLQYNPGLEAHGKVATRAILNWDMETKEKTFFVYECNYDGRIYGFLYDIL